LLIVLCKVVKIQACFLCNYNVYLHTIYVRNEGLALVPKIRKIPSIEQGLYEAIRILKDVGIEDAVRKYTTAKKASLFRNCADPDLAGHNIQHIDSVAIDKECLNTDGSHPLLSSHQALLKKHVDENVNVRQKNLPDLINQLAIIIGEFQTTIHKAQSPDGPGGAKLTAEEKIKVNDAINKLDLTLKDLKIAIGENNKY